MVGKFLSCKEILAIFTTLSDGAYPPGIQPRLENEGSRASSQMSGSLGGSKKCPEASSVAHLTREDN